MNPGDMLGPYRVLEKLGEGGPPPLLGQATSYGEAVSPKPAGGPR